MEYPDNKNIYYEYDGENRIIEVKKGSTRQSAVGVKMIRDGNGNPIKYINENGFEFRHDYDRFDRLVRVTDPLGNYVEYEYNADGKKTLERRVGAVGGQGLGTSSPDPNARFELESISYSYDERGKLSEIDQKRIELDEGGNVVRDNGYAVTRIYRDGRGRITTVINDRGKAVTTTYDGLGRAIKTQDSLGNKTENTYDKVGNKTLIVETEKSDNGAYSETFTTVQEFDTMNRLLKVTGQDGKYEKYSYDSLNVTLRPSPC